MPNNKQVRRQTSTSVFTDVIFTTGTDVTPSQLYQQLKSNMNTIQLDFLLTRIPTKKLFSGRVEGGTFSHIIIIDKTRFLTIHDPAQAIIWKMTGTELQREHEFTLNQEDEQFAWESIIVDNIAYILLSFQLSRIDLRIGAQLPPIKLQEKDIYRFSHTNMIKTRDGFMIANGEPKINCYSNNGDLVKQIPETESDSSQFLTLCVINDEIIAIGTDTLFHIYNLGTQQMEFTHLEDQFILSIQYFPEYDMIVYGVSNGNTVFFDVKNREIVGRQTSDHTWNTVVRIGRTWVASIYFNHHVDVFDIITRERIHRYHENVTLSVAPWRDKLVLQTQYEVSVWI